MKSKNTVKRVLDVALTVALLLLMAFQVTEQLAHEWLGITMVVLTVVHQVLNRKFYAAIFKGRYSPLRVFQLIVNLLLVLSFLCTALSGMMMSRYATPFLNGILTSSIVRQGHLAMSHWSFVLMGTHLGLHIPAMAAGMKLEGRKKTVAAAVFCAVACAGMFLFVRSGMFDYMFFSETFAFLDYDKAGVLVFLENLQMLLAWAFIGDRAAVMCKKTFRKHDA